MKTLHSIAFALAAFLLASCQPADSKSASATSTNDEATTPSADTDPAYWHLTGQVGTLAVVMDLAFRPAGGDEFSTDMYHGSYYYSSKENPIDIYGSVDSTGQLVLYEVTLTDETSPTFTGTFDRQQGAFKGEWSSGDGKKKMAVELRENYDDALRFTTHKLEASQALFDGNENSPYATTSKIWLRPATGTDAATASFLEKAIHQGLVGDSLAALYPKQEKAFEVVSKAYFESYRTDMDDVSAEEIGPDDTFMFTYEQNASAEVLYNQNQLLTIGYWDYWFSGGAHGNYGTWLASYDLTDRKEITLQDVFLPGYETKITSSLEKAVRSRFGLKAKEALSSVLFEDAIAATENFGLTGKGVIFNYPPYEIAAYASGEIRLFVPYSEIKDLLQPVFAAKYVK
ncbi:MAG: DUF3298 and DUF4163 domain-containing protein [Saprospiraceae bacterium]|nr:DUF3298 and DUF4163 domain-containing protein [Saprospiraceae bacterium]